ncbi:uncharacterized protein [Salminus brasiliensis]|uniref:uncharacterized protein n=1 Tax=Salminus brasiliensis TaxID=930266 RepID=UPI003B831B72
MSVCVENQGRQFVKAVSPSLKKGIIALNDLTISLLDMDKDSVAKSDSKSFRKIRSAIISAKQNLEEAELAARRELQMVDECYENLMIRKGNLSRQHESTKARLQDLKHQQKSNKATLDVYRAGKETAMGRLREARDVLWHQKRKVEEAESLWEAGIGITVIPIFGWIAGPIMITAAESNIENASYGVQEAERIVDGFESQVRDFSRAVSDCQRRIEQTCNEISKTEDKLRQIAWNIEEVLMQRRVIADFQVKTRNSVKVLGCLAGTSSVAEIQTRCFVLLEAMIKLMQNFVKLVEGIREDRLLRDEGIKALITNLQVNYIKMQAITWPSDTTTIEDYI